MASSLHYSISLSLSRLSVIFCSLLFNHPFGDVENEKKKTKTKTNIKQNKHEMEKHFTQKGRIFLFSPERTFKKRMYI